MSGVFGDCLQVVGSLQSVWEELAGPEHLLGARWKGRSDVPGAASLRETTFRTPRQAHWPETDWGALHPPAPSSEGHPRTGRVSEEAHEPKDQSSKHVRARWGRASVGGQGVGRIQQLF